MIGMDATTGKHLAGREHVRQSVRDILATPIGSRIMNREYGSRLFELVDAPVTPSTVVDWYAAVAEALDRWEPRVRVTSVRLVELVDGRPTFDVAGVYLADGEPILLEGIAA